MLWLAALSAILLRRDNVVAALQKGGGQGKTKPAYQISPKPCWVDGVEGTCMFVYECIKSEGYHVGMCVDTFMFGSCCAYNATTNAVTSQAHGHDQNHHHQPHHQPQHGSGKPSVLYTPPSQTTAKRPATTSRPKYTSRPQPNSSTSSQNQQRPPASASSSISHKPSPSSSTSTTVKQRPATPPPRHSIRPMSTDILHGSNTILVSEYTKPHHQQHQHLMGAKPYHQYQSWPHQQQQQIPQTQNQHQQSSTKPGWQATTEPGFITGHNSITKPTANWQVTTEPGFVTKVKTKPGNAGYKVKPTKKPFPVTTAKNATKYGSKSTSTTTAVPSTHSTFSTTLSTVAPSKR